MKKILSFLLSMTIIISILPTNVTAGENSQCTKITAKYNSDGSLKEVNTEIINISDIMPVNNTSEEKTFYWNSLGGMQPINPSATNTPSDADYTFVFGADNSNDNIISVDEATTYGVQANGMSYGFYGLKDSPDVSDGRTDGFESSDTDPYSVIKSGIINGKSYVEADYSTYDTDTISNMAGAVMPIRFSVGAQQHTYYTVTATVVNTSDTENANINLWSEKRHVILSDKILAPGETVTKTFNVLIESVYYNVGGIKEDNQINICVAGKNAGLASVRIKKHNSIGKTIWMCTDSTGYDKSTYIPYYPLRSYAGFGAAISKYINPEIAISNQGEGGLEASDSNHFNNAVKYMQSGDYLLVAYGWNDASASVYKRNLEKYYTAAHEKGVKLIIVSPTDRRSNSNWENNLWTASNADLSIAGKEFVDEKIAAGAKDIAFVDLNTAFVEWMNTAEQEILQQRQKLGFSDNAVDKRAMDYYYVCDRSVGVDTIHINDFGADNAAYIFAQQAKKIVDAGKMSDASDSDKIQSSVLSELTENMSDEARCIVSDETVKDGWAPNKFYPYPSGESVEYQYPTMVKSVDTENNMLKSMTVKVQGEMSKYAQGCADILDSNGAVINTVYTVSTNVNSSIGHIDNTSAKYGDIVTMYFDENTSIPTGGNYKVYVKSLENGATVPDDTYYSSIYSEPPGITSYLMTGADGVHSDTFDYSVDDNTSIKGLGAFAQSGTKAWEYVGSTGVSYMNTAIKDNITSIRLSQNGSGTYSLCRFFNNKTEVSSGKIKLHFGINFVYGTFAIKLYSSDKTASSMNGINVAKIEDGEVKLYDGTSAGKLKTGKWTNIDIILDIDRGTESISIAGSDAVQCNIADLQTSLWSDTEKLLPIKGITVASIKNPPVPSYPFEFYMTDLLIASVETDTPQINISVSSDNNENGSVSGSGIVDINSNTTISAAAETGYTFAGWYNGNELYSNENPLTLEKVRTDISLTAHFAIQKSKEETASFDIISDKSFVKNISSIQLGVANAKDKDGYAIGNLTAADIEWSCNETGVTITENGLVTFDESFIIDENSTKTINITGTINNATQTLTITVYSYEYYEEFNAATTNYNGNFKTIAEKSCIIFPDANTKTIYTLKDTVQFDKTKTIKLNHAWSGSNTCGQYRTLNFKDSSDNTIFSMYYSWTSLIVNGEKLSGIIKKNEWTQLVIKVNPTTNTITVTAGEQSVTTPLNGTELSKIELVSAKDVPSGRELGISDIIIN